MLCSWLTTKPLPMREEGSVVVGRRMPWWSSGNPAGCLWPQQLQRSWFCLNTEGSLGEQLSAAKWISWWCKCFSLSSLEECECLLESQSCRRQVTARLSPTWGTETEQWTGGFQRLVGLNWLWRSYPFLGFLVVQWCGSEHSTGTSHANRIGPVAELWVASAVFC